MIIEIFILFTSLAFILAIVGHFIDNELLIIFGFLVIGLMALPLINQSLDYRTGSHIDTYYNSTTDITSSDITIEYATYTDTVWFGIFFLLITVGGLFTLYNGYGRQKKDEDDTSD